MRLEPNALQVCYVSGDIRSKVNITQLLSAKILLGFLYTLLLVIVTKL